jgi:serine phosphatase RsbU (regulator of sigma subunit)
VDDLFEAAGALRDAYESVDWAATPLGPVSTWSPTLAATLRMALKTRFAATLLWGPEYVLMYNEAYVPMIAGKHPAALGAPAREVFPEIWDTIGPMIDTAAKGGEAIWMQDLRLLMDRHGYLEETYFTFSYSAVTGPGGHVEGVIDIAAETTQQVIGNRRLQLLRRLDDQLADVQHRGQLIDRALPVLRAATDDLPAVALIIEASSEPSPDLEPEEPVVTAPSDPVTAVHGPDGTSVHIRLSHLTAGSDEPVLTVRLSPHLAPDETYLGFLRLLGGTLTQALDRIQARRADRLLASMERAMSETLQDSLLTQAVQPPYLHVAVRYQSSIAQAHIGGDWYDAFLLPDGRLTVAVGDVSGHDRNAAAAMAQLRNLLRGIAFTVQSPPSKILTGLGAAMSGLPVDAYATVVLAQIEQDEQQARLGLRTLRWSNAGHPPPVLLTADGAVRLLQTPPETLLGTRGTSARSDHTVTLEPGASVVFYTDGLIERRHITLDDGLDHLSRVLAGAQHLDAEELCDHLLRHLAADAEDDIALTVVRACPEMVQL